MFNKLNEIRNTVVIVLSCLFMLLVETNLVAASLGKVETLFDAGCTTAIKIIPTNPTTCAGNGSINVTMSTEYRVRITPVSTGIPGSWTTGNINFTGLVAGQYRVEVENISPSTICRDFIVTLFFAETALFTSSTVTNSSSCTSNNGIITLNGLAASTEISWMTYLSRTWTPKASLAGGNQITGLAPGQYVVLVRRASSPFCYQTATITVGPTNCESTSLCGASLGTNRFPNGDFGSGSNVQGPALSNSETNYFYTTMQCNQPDDGQYSIINTADCNGSSSGGAIFNAFDILAQDHTTGDMGGYMMLVNASYAPDIAFQKQITGLCPNTEYEFSAWIYNIQPAAGIKPNLTFVIDGVGRYSSGNITATGWQNVGFRFKTGAGTSSTFSIRNNNTGGLGNDWVVDDIFVGICESLVAVSPTTACIGDVNIIASATITDAQTQFSWYKWQYSDNGTTWLDATSAAQGTFTGTSYTVTYALPSPITLSIAGRQYRINVATSSSNLGSELCSAISSGVLQVSNLNPGTVGTDQTVCSPGDPALFTNTSSATGGGTITYKWQISTTSTSAGFSDIAPAATSTTYNAPAGLTTTSYYRRLATSSLGSCSAISNVITVEVNTITGGTISAAQTICVGGDPQTINGTN